MWVEFLVTSLIVVLAPGTGVIYTLAHGITHGAAGSVFAAFGCTLGIIPHICAAVFGLAALLYASALAFEVVKYLGVAYLLYMAWGVLREKGAINIDEKVEGATKFEIVVKGFLINILNPKLAIFFMAFLPQFIEPTLGSATLQMMALGAVFMAMTLLVFVGYGLSAASVRSHVINNPKILTWLRRTFASAFILLGAKLALADR